MRKAMRWRNLVLALVFLLAAAGLAFHAVSAKKQADTLEGVTLDLKTPLSAGDLQLFHETVNEMPFTALREISDVTVMDPDLGNETQTRVMLLDGSSELLPGKWSDFSGWEDNFAQKREDFGLFLQVNKNSVEFYYMCQCFLYIWDTVLEVICVMGRCCASHPAEGVVKNRSRRPRS